jgi:cation diffusion facilitator family transporter
VLWAGITAVMESWPKIFTPDVTNYSTVSLVIIAVAIVVKLALGRYVKSVGEDINSQALVASGSDALFDSILSLSTLVAALISIFFHISLEGILGAIISIVIIKASIDMIRETLDSMIGARVDSELSRKIKDSICELPEVYGAYDLSLHNYGPEEMQGSVHVEVDDSLTALEIHNLTRQISIKIYNEFSIILTVGIYARNNKFDDIRNDLYEIASKYEEIIEIHGFIVYETQNLITFDMIVDFDADREKVKSRILKEIKQKHPQYTYQVIDDYDVSD